MAHFFFPIITRIYDIEVTFRDATCTPMRRLRAVPSLPDGSQVGIREYTGITRADAMHGDAAARRQTSSG